MVVVQSHGTQYRFLLLEIDDYYSLKALEYSKTVKSNNAQRNASKLLHRQRPASERKEELSALEIMKQRHEAERLKVEEMRQNLSRIIKDVRT